ncbi:ATPase [Spirochaetia bacterium]|nr:ATPase [Spirochaetia bacterium]
MLERTMKTAIEKTAQGFPVILLTGMRQVGKTTLLAAMAEPERKYVSLDNLDARKLAQTDPKTFIAQYSPPCIIDEVQYAPELFTYIKIYVDEHKIKGDNVKGAFWLTGSQQYRLMKGVQESLAGRIAILDMMGLSCKEIQGKAFDSKPFLPSMALAKYDGQANEYSPEEIYKLIWQGSFPAPLTDTTIDRDTFYDAYLRTYIERDVKDFQGLTNDLGFYDFIRAAAARTGCLLNYADISRDVGIDMKTAKIWLSTLERSGIIKLLEPYSPNVTQRIIKTPKLYFLDTGLASFLTQWNSPESLMSGAQNGAMLETWVFTEILKSYWHNGKRGAIYFYRDTHQKEIDFVIEQDMTLYPIEVKKTAMPSRTDLRHFKVLEALGKKVGTGAVICFYPTVMPLGEDIISYPVWKI